MNTLLLTIAGGEHEKIAEVTVPALTEYADSIGASIAVVRSKINNKLNWSWNKLLWFDEMSTLYHYDKIILCDIDCIPLKLGVVPAPKHLERLWVSRDHNGICCGFMVLPVNFFTRRLVQAWLLLGQMDDWKEFDGRDTWEQNTLKAMMKTSPYVRMMVEQIAEKEVANPSTKGLTERPIFYHAWANQGVDATVEKLKECSAYPTEFLKKTGVMV